jgi:molybdate-binding protein
MVPEGRDQVLLTWAWRSQGLVVEPGNPKGLRSLADLAGKAVRFLPRQPEAGTQVLLDFLLKREGLSLEELDLLPEVARNQTDIGLAVLEGRADTGLAVEAAARQLKLDFVPLHRERFDLVVRRFDFFEPPFQRLLGFARTEEFSRRAERMGGYEISELGSVVQNGF